MVPFISGASTPFRPADDWKLTFYTGDKIWAGTDSQVYAQVHGTSGDSPIYQLTPEKYQMEAQAVDFFYISLPKNLGNIKSITVGKQHSYSFFNDWQLIKVELTDPVGKKYTFQCNCWLTTLRFKRTIELTSMDGVDQDPSSHLDPFIGPGKTTRVFPMTIGLLFLLLILIIFTYFGNVMCKKWKENVFLSGSSARRSRHSRSTNGNSSSRGAPHRSGLNTSTNQASNHRHTTRNDLYKDDDDDDDENAELAHGVYNITNNLNDLNVNSTTHRSNLSDSHARNSHGLFNEDKPPDYTQLFPLKTINETTANNKSTSTNSTATTPQDMNQNNKTEPNNNSLTSV